MQDILSRNIPFFCSFLLVVSLSGQASPPKWISGSYLGTDSLWKTKLPFCSSAIYLYVHVCAVNHGFSKKNETQNATWQLFLEGLSGVKAKKTHTHEDVHSHTLWWCVGGPQQDWVDFMKYPAGPAVGERASLWSTKRGLFCWRGSLPRQPPQKLGNPAVLPPFPTSTSVHLSCCSSNIYYCSCFCLADDKWSSYRPES